eukprot:7651429-Pyramimonas_sp.AAC.1
MPHRAHGYGGAYTRRRRGVGVGREECAEVGEGDLHMSNVRLGRPPPARARLSIGRASSVTASVSARRRDAATFQSARALPSR